MSAARSIVLLGLPGIAIVLGILWYRKRNPLISDPGGSNKHKKLSTPNKNTVCDPIPRELEKVIEEKVIIKPPATETVELSKSLPIDIPVGSPIELTDDQLDIEILKIQSQKSQGKETFKKPLKLASLEKTETIEKCFKSPLKIESPRKMAEDQEAKPITSEPIENDEACVLDNSDNSASVEDVHKDSEIERSDWSEELCDLECQADATSGTDHVRDSAYHSPTENMSSSPQLSAYSDRHSEHSLDSGKGSSPRSELASTFEFVLPQHVVGRLIGRNGAFVHRIKALTGANILVKKHPESTRQKICAVEGLQTEIDAALVMIRSKFPEKKFPSITLQRVSFPQTTPVNAGEISPECITLQLVEGVNNDCTVSSVQEGGSISLQQPLHPSFPSLNLLQCCMVQTYANADNPMLPAPVTAGMVCACPVDSCWYRAQITNVLESTVHSDDNNSVDNNSDDPQVELRLVDYGNRVIMQASRLRQIRADLMMLPFQAVDCVLANVQPLKGASTFSQEAVECLRTLTCGRLLQAQIYGFLDDIPLVHLYCTISSNQVVFVNQELVARGLAEWTEAET